MTVYDFAEEFAACAELGRKNKTEEARIRLIALEREWRRQTSKPLPYHLIRELE